MDDEVTRKMKAINALLFCVSQVDSEVPNIDLAQMWLSDELGKCIEEIENI